VTLGLRRVTYTNALCVPTFKTPFYYASAHLLVVYDFVICNMKLHFAINTNNASDYVVITESK